MTVATEVVARRYEDIEAGVPVSVDYPVYEATDIGVYYGNASLKATLNTDYSISLGEDFNTFTLTPMAALLDKIDALIAVDATEINYITVRRELDLLTSADAAAVRYTPFTAREFDRTAMRFQQVEEKLNRSLTLAPSSVGDQPLLQLNEIEPNATLIVNADGTAIGVGPTAAQVEAAEAYAQFVAGMEDEINVVAANVVPINILYDDIVGGNHVGIVAGSIANVNAVGGNITQVLAVEANETNINAVAGNATNINAAVANETAINAAPQAATDAAAARDLAQQWANEDEDVVVAGGGYSAYHWSKKAEQAAAGSSDNISNQSDVDGATVTDALNTLAAETDDLFADKLNVDASNVGDATAQTAFRNAIGAIAIGDVPTPTIASQAQAEAGSDNTNFMTPLRTAQAIAANPPTSIDASAVTSGTLPVDRGGTGATTEAEMRGVYTGSSNSNTNYPIGTLLWAQNPADAGMVQANATVSLRISSGQFIIGTSGGSAVTGTWRCRGCIPMDNAGSQGSPRTHLIAQRVA